MCCYEIYGTVLPNRGGAGREGGVVKESDQLGDVNGMEGV